MYEVLHQKTAPSLSLMAQHIFTYNSVSKHIALFALRNISKKEPTANQIWTVLFLFLQIILTEQSSYFSV